VDEQDAKESVVMGEAIKRQLAEMEREQAEMEREQAEKKTGGQENKKSK